LQAMVPLLEWLIDCVMNDEYVVEDQVKMNVVLKEEQQVR
jgi:hypothetical protein